MGDATRSAIEGKGNEVLVSTVSLWEIAIKPRLSTLDVDLAAMLGESAERSFACWGLWRSICWG